MANLIDSRIHLEGIVYAFIDEEGTLTISSSIGDTVAERHVSYLEEIILSKDGSEVLREYLNRAAEHRNEAVTDGDVCPECGGYFNQVVCEACGYH